MLGVRTRGARPAQAWTAPSAPFPLSPPALPPRHLYLKGRDSGGTSRRAVLRLPAGESEVRVSVRLRGLQGARRSPPLGRRRLGDRGGRRCSRARPWAPGCHTAPQWMPPTMIAPGCQCPRPQGRGQVRLCRTRTLSQKVPPGQGSSLSTLPNSGTVLCRLPEAFREYPRGSWRPITCTVSFPPPHPRTKRIP